MSTATKPELPIIAFKTPKDWQHWLAKNHATAPGILLRLFRKSSGIESITYDQALDEALCYGWIDGLKKSYDDQSWTQKFTPRRPKSLWSKRNIEHVARLTKLTKMKPAGLKQIELAQADGRWAQAYDSPSNMQIPEDFLKLLSKNKPALKFFQTLNRVNTYAIAFRLQTAEKPETRQRRLTAILDMLTKGKKFY